MLLDVIYNHLGPAGNYLECFGPYFTARHQTPWGPAVNLDGPGSEEVRRFFCDNALMWLRDYHLDGLRLDAVHALVDTSAMPFLEQLAAEVHALEAHLGRHLVLIAESDLEEWGASTPFQYFTDHEDAELARAVSEGGRSEFAAFGWAPAEVPDPQEPPTYLRSRLDGRELACEPHASILDWHERLVRLRRRSTTLADRRMDQVRVRFDEAARWLTVERGPIIVACNLATGAQRVPLGREPSGEVLLTSDPMIEVNASGAALPPDSVVVLGPAER